MSTITILIAIALCIAFMLCISSVYYYFHNQSSRADINRFKKELAQLNPIVFENIKLHYQYAMTRIGPTFPNSKATVYIFDDSLVILISQKFVFKAIFKPILVASYTSSESIHFRYLKRYIPNRIYIKKSIKGAIELELVNPASRDEKTLLTMVALPEEQVKIIESINWNLENSLTNSTVQNS